LEGEVQERKCRHASLTCCHALLRMSQAAQRQMAWGWHCNESPRGLPPACLPAHYCQAGSAVMTCCQGFCLSLWGPQCSDSARRAVWLELSWYKCPQEYLQPACLSGQPHMLEPACAAALDSQIYSGQGSALEQCCRCGTYSKILYHAMAVLTQPGWLHTVQCTISKQVIIPKSLQQVGR